MTQLNGNGLKGFGELLKANYGPEPDIAAYMTPERTERFEKFLSALGVVPGVLRLDRLAHAAIRYELADPHPPERLRELELVTTRSCGEWFQRTMPGATRAEWEWERE
jgi:hypothetical protein